MSMLFLTLLVAGVIDIGRAFFTYIALRDAAQEGAAFASIAREYLTDTIDSAYCASIVNRAQQTSNTQIVDLNQTTVTCDLRRGCLRKRYQFECLFWTDDPGSCHLS